VLSFSESVGMKGKIYRVEIAKSVGMKTLNLWEQKKEICGIEIAKSIGLKYNIIIIRRY